MSASDAAIRPTAAAAEDAVQRFLDAKLGRDDYPLTLIPDGDDGWAFWLLENDTTSYVHKNLHVEWYGTMWDGDDVEAPHA